MTLYHILHSEYHSHQTRQAELHTWFHGLSVEFEYMFPWYHNDSNHKYYQILNGTVGIRKYFNNEYTKWYVGIYGNTMVISIFQLTKKRDGRVKNMVLDCHWDM